MSFGKAFGPASDPDAIVVHPEPQKKAQMDERAKEKGISVEDLVLLAIDKFLADEASIPSQKPTRSLRGILAKFGPAPSAEEIKKNRAEMFSDILRNNSE